MRILVTGAGGFIGSHVVKKLVLSGHEVHGLLGPSGSDYRLKDVLDRIAILHFELARGDLRAVVDSVSPELVFHLGWYARPHDYLTNIGENIDSLTMTLRLIEALSSHNSRLILAGSCLEGTALDRQGRPVEKPFYATAKSAMHEVAMAMSRQGIPTVCAHIFQVYGPGEDKSRVIPSVIRSLLQGKLIGVTGGEQWRDFMHVSDLADALCEVGLSDFSGALDLCTGEPKPLADIFNLLEGNMGARGLVKLRGLPYSSGEVFDYAGDASTLRDRIGWRGSFSLAEGLQNTIEWWKTQLDAEKSEPPRMASR